MQIPNSSFPRRREPIPVGGVFQQAWEALVVVIRWGIAPYLTKSLRSTFVNTSQPSSVINVVSLNIAPYSPSFRSATG